MATEFVTAYSRGKSGTKVRVSAAFAEAAGLAVADEKSSASEAAKSTNKEADK